METQVKLMSVHDTKLQREKEEMSERLEYLATSNEEMKTEINEHNLEWDNVFTDESEQQDKIKSLLKTIGEKDELISSLRKRESAVEKDHLDGKPESERVYNELGVLVVENEKLQNEKSELMKKNEFLDSENKIVMEHNDLLESEVKEMKEEKKTMKQEILQNNQNLAEKDRQIADLINTQEHYKENLKKYEHNVIRLTDQADTVTSQRESLDFDLREKSSFLKELEKKLEESTRQIVELEMLLETEKHHRTNVEQENQATRDRLAKMEDDREKLRKRLLEQENESKQLKVIENTTLKSNMSLEQELMSKILESERLQQQLEDMDNKHEHLKRDLDRTKNMLLEVEEAKEEIEDDVEILQERIKALEKEILSRENLNVTLNEENRNLQSAREELQEIKEQLENEIARVKKEKDALYQELSLITESTVKKDAFVEKDALLAEQIRINKALAKDIKEKDEVIEDLEERLDSLFERLRMEKKKNEGKIVELAKDLMTTRSASKETKDEVESLVHKNSTQVRLIQTLKEELSTKTSKIDELEDQNLALGDEKEKLENALKNTKTKAERFTRDLESEREKVEELMQGLKENQKKLTTTLRMKDKAQMENEELNTIINELKIKNEQMFKKIGHLQQHSQMEESRFSKLEVDIAARQELEEEIKGYKQKLLASVSTHEVTCHKLDNAEMEIAKKEKYLVELQEKLRNSTQNETRLKELLQTSENASVSKDAHNYLKKQLDEKSIQIQNAEQRFRESEENATLLSDENEKTKKKNVYLEELVKNMKDELEQITPKHQNVKEELDAAQRKIKVLDYQVKLKEETLSVNHKEGEKNQAKIEELLGEIEELQFSVAELRTEIESQNTKIGGMSKQNRELTQERQEINENSMVSGKTIVNLKHALERSERKKASAENSLQQTQGTLNDVEKKNSDLQKQLQEALGKELEQDERIENLNKENENMSQQHERFVAERQAVKYELEEKESEVSKLQLEVSSEKRSLSNLQNKHKQLQDELAKLHDGSRDAKKQNDKLTQDLRFTRSEVVSYERKIAQLTEDMELLSDKFELLGRENAKLNETVIANEEEFNELYTRYQELQEKHDTVQQKYNRAASELERLEKTKKSAVDEREVLKNEVDTVSGKLSALNSALDKSREQRQDLLRELNVTRQKQSEMEEEGEETKQAIVKR